jgi:hypothetical protein
VRGDRDALLVGADGEVELGLDHPQLVIGLERVIRVAEGGGLQTDEPLDLPREVLVLRSDAVPTVATVAPWLPPSSASAESGAPSPPPS